MQPNVRFRRPVAALAVAAVAAIGCASAGPSAPPPAGAAAVVTAQAAQPMTEAGVRAAATAFYALHAAGQWDAAWAYLAPASQKAVPESTYVAVLRGCPSRTAGMARVIKSVTMAGSTAVVTETVAGALGAIGTAADAWTYSGGRWGYELTAQVLADYSRGSTAADIAAFKADGYCAGSEPSFTPLPTVAPATMPPLPSLTPLPTIAPS